MNIGIDIHGCIDKKPKFFSIFTKRARLNGHKIYIITGGQKKSNLLNLLNELNIEYDYFLSVSDYLIENNNSVRFEDSNNPWFDNDIWNKTKSIFCTNYKIDIHFDDSDIYGKYFKTLYFRIKAEHE